MLAGNSELGSLGAVAEGHKPMTVHTLQTCEYMGVHVFALDKNVTQKCTIN
jgi:hypothetical protein